MATKKHGKKATKAQETRGRKPRGTAPATHRLTIRLSDEEQALLKSAAGENDLATWARDLLLAHATQGEPDTW